jgi:hypothetical protein
MIVADGAVFVATAPGIGGLSAWRVDGDGPTRQRGFCSPRIVTRQPHSPFGRGERGLEALSLTSARSHRGTVLQTVNCPRHAPFGERGGDLLTHSDRPHPCWIRRRHCALRTKRPESRIQTRMMAKENARRFRWTIPTWHAPRSIRHPAFEHPVVVAEAF